MSSVFKPGVVYTVDKMTLFVPTVPGSYRKAVSPGDQFIVAEGPRWRQKEFFYFRLVSDPKTYHFGLTRAHAEKVVPFEK